MSLKKAFHKNTSQYVCNEAWEDEYTFYLLKAQYGSLVNKYIKNYTEDQLFTLLIVDRSDFGPELPNVVTPNTPYIDWMVANIKGDDIESRNEFVPYLSWSFGEDQHGLLYKQQYEITDLPMTRYTRTDCRAEVRCGFTHERFVWDYDLELVGAGRYDIINDV